VAAIDWSPDLRAGFFGGGRDGERASPEADCLCFVDRVLLLRVGTGMAGGTEAKNGERLLVAGDSGAESSPDDPDDSGEDGQSGEDGEPILLDEDMEPCESEVRSEGDV